METKLGKLLKKIDETIETPLVTARFGDNWKEYMKEQLEKGDCDIDTLINIAWKQGRKAILLERELEKLLK